MHISSSARQPRPFNLMRWFSLAAFASIALVSATAAWFFSHFLAERMIRQEAEVTAGFVRSIVATENAYAYFDGSSAPATEQLQNFLDHITRMPGVLRTNVYSAERKVVWSSDPALIGQRFDRNDELEEALRADLVVHSGIIDPAHLPKSEHQHLGSASRRFVESYIPIFDVHDRRVVGVVELYVVPEELFEAIESGIRLIWIAAALAGIFLFTTLFWIVRRAHRIIDSQGDRILESESLAMVGEMGSAVAHGLRNPLAAIRSSAELALDSDLPAEAREYASDIIGQVDRLEGWVRQLLTYAKPAHATLGPVDINTVLKDTASDYRRDLERHRIDVAWNLADDLPPVRADAMMLRQLIGNLVTNAIEAMPEGGRLTLASGRGAGGSVVAEVGDDGPGISAADMGRIFKPFFTNKPRGIGLGLPLVRRVVERLGGSVELDSQPRAGTTIRLALPTWN